MAEQNANWPVIPAFSRNVEDALQVVNRIAAEHQTMAFVYHHFGRTAALMKLLEDIAIGNRTDETDWETAALALLFCDAGRWINPQFPQTAAEKQADSFCQQTNQPPTSRLRILNTIHGIFHSEPEPKEIALQLALDTVNICDMGTHADEYLQKIPAECELLNLPTPEDHHGAYIRRLAAIRLFTPFARANWSTLLSGRLITETTPQTTETNTLKPYENLEKKTPVRGLQTFFRSNYRSHLNLSAIADNKANIMISINTILVSVLISLLTYKNITETQPKIIMPVIIFLMTGLTSLIFAILSVRPKVTSLVHRHMPPQERPRNLMFFGNFVHLTLPEYEAAMDELLRSSELVYGNMSRDLYHLGKVLDKKYKLLTVSYHIFMIGFAATVISFLILLLL
jgi:hypothetical protein